MQDLKAQAACLDTLQLLNVGSVFNDRLDGDSERLAQTKRRLQATMPPAIDKYHGALDALEADIMRAKLLISRDLAMMQAASKAPATPPKTAESSAQGTTSGEPSQLEQSTFELINDSDLVMTDASAKDAPAAPASNQPSQASATAAAVKMEKTDSRSSASAQTKANVKAGVDGDDNKKPTASAPDEQGNNALGIQVQADSKPDATAETKTSPKDQNEHASDNGFNELLPGLYDAAGVMDMDPLNDHAFSNEFGDAGGDAHMADFEAGLFGEGEDSNNSFGDMINLDSTNGQNGQNDEGQGAMEMFDDDFFNL